jgi:plasmid stabilization system protein ParE
MPARGPSTTEKVANILRQCLDDGKKVEIDGLGVFRPDGEGRYEFIPRTRPKIFLAYVEEDRAAAERIFEDLHGRDFEPWLDQRMLLPGQNWPRSIEDAIETSDFFLPCFSRLSVSKKGGFQAEIRHALDGTRRLPLDEVFIVPVRLDACRLPARIQREIQYIDLFPSWEKGLTRVAAVIARQMRKRAGNGGRA